MPNRVGSFSTFAGVAPPWSLPNLDANFVAVTTAFNDASLGYVNAIQTDGGTANNYLVTCIFGVPSAYNQGMYIAFIPANTNSGGSTLTVNSLASITILDIFGNPVQAGMLPAGRLVELIYIGSNFRLVNPFTTGGVPYSYDWDDLTGNAKFLVPLNNGTSSAAGSYGVQQVGHPGVYNLQTGTVSGTYGILVSGASVFLDTFTWSIRSTIAPSTIGANANLIFGFDSNPGAILTVRNGIFIFGAQGTANWQCRCSTGAANTQVDSGVAFSALVWHDMEIVANTASVSFYIDGALITTITTNIPISSAALRFGDMATTGGGQSALLVDDFEFLIQNIPALGTNRRFLYGPL